MMKKTLQSSFYLSFLMLITSFSFGQPNAWINEIHYDNSSTDVDELVEVVIENAGSYTLSDFTVTLYNGSSSSGAPYSTETLNSFTEGTTVGNFTFYYLNYTNSSSYGSIQNGSPDGIALSYSALQILEFLKQAVPLSDNLFSFQVQEPNILILAGLVLSQKPQEV